MSFRTDSKPPNTVTFYTVQHAISGRHLFQEPHNKNFRSTVCFGKLTSLQNTLRLLCEATKSRRSYATARMMFEKMFTGYEILEHTLDPNRPENRKVFFEVSNVLSLPEVDIKDNFNIFTSDSRMNWLGIDAARFESLFIESTAKFVTPHDMAYSAESWLFNELWGHYVDSGELPEISSRFVLRQNLLPLVSWQKIYIADFAMYKILDEPLVHTTAEAFEIPNNSKVHTKLIAFSDIKNINLLNLIYSDAVTIFDATRAIKSICKAGLIR